MRIRTAFLICLLPLSFEVSAAPTEEQYNSINDLAAAGEMAKAKERLDLFLGLYPEDATLLEMQEVLLRGDTSGTDEEKYEVVSAANQGEDLLEIRTVIKMLEQISSIDTESVKKEVAEKILQREIPDAATTAIASDWLAYWTVRATAALQINDHELAWQAGQQLKRLNSINSNNEMVAEVMVSLNSAGLLGKKPGVKTVERIVQTNGATYTDTSDQVRGYVIKEGDSLHSIARKMGITTDTLKKLNPELVFHLKLPVGKAIRIIED